jgi:hypothetical protein
MHQISSLMSLCFRLPFNIYRKYLQQKVIFEDTFYNSKFRRKIEKLISISSLVLILLTSKTESREEKEAYLGHHNPWNCSHSDWKWSYIDLISEVERVMSHGEWIYIYEIKYKKLKNQWRKSSSHTSMPVKAKAGTAPTATSWTCYSHKDINFTQI